MAYIGSPAAPTIATVSDDTITSAKIADGAVTPSDLSTGHPNWDSSGNLLVGKTNTARSTVGVEARPDGFIRSTKNDGHAGDFVRNSSDGDVIRCYYENTLNGTIGIVSGGMYFGSGSSGTERMRLDTSGNLKFDSGYGSVATAYGCRAWVNFDGTGTVAIRASGNVSSITDIGVGIYDMNFTTAFSAFDYAVVTNSGGSTAATGDDNYGSFDYPNSGTSKARIRQLNAAGSRYDATMVCCAVIR